MLYTEREAQDRDYEFLFSLKKAAEFDAIKAVFGWDEKLQWEIHLDEWNEAKPRIIEIEGKQAGSYLMLDKGDHWYFCRFFLLPEFHGQGIGSRILNRCIRQASAAQKPIRLSYLQGNRVGGLYQRSWIYTNVRRRAFCLYDFGLEMITPTIV